MIGIGIDDNVSAALRKFENVIGGTALVPIVLKAGQAAGVAAESVVSPYPAQARYTLPLFYSRTRKDGTTYKSKFKTAKQQGYVMSLAARGLIPYKRTGTLGRSITSEARNASVNGVDVLIGTNRKYAPLVIGAPAQQYYHHRKRWTPLETDIERNVNTIADAFGRAALKGINDYLNSST